MDLSLDKLWMYYVPILDCSMSSVCHLNGAVYGSPEKIKDGRMPVKNLFICGTDQGFLGIIGATLSGISMANLHVLMADRPR